jgi:hypothetical protein
MPHVPPINRRKLGKEGLLNEEEFYGDVALESGLDAETVKRVYLAMVRVIGRRLFSRFVCRLPHLGDYSLHMVAKRSVLVGKNRTILPPRRVLKFYPLEKWVRYINTRLGYDNESQ